MADIIADCVMGIQSDSFKDVNSPLLVNKDKMFHYSFVYMTLIGLLPGIAKLKKSRSVSKEYETYFVGLMKEAIELRKSQPEGEKRCDFLNYILQLQEEKNLTTMEVCSHSLIFVLEGFETVSSLLAHTLLMVCYILVFSF